ncbi:MAG: transporter [Cyanobacteria bacterium J06627_32]
MALFVTSQEILLLLFSVLTAACGQLLLKLGAVKINLLEASTMIGKIWEAVTIPELIIGLTFYGVSAVAYILLLTRVKLSVAAPGTASIYILSVLMGIWVLKEPVVPARLFGLALIACGVVLVVSK